MNIIMETSTELNCAGYLDIIPQSTEINRFTRLDLSYYKQRIPPKDFDLLMKIIGILP